MDSLSYTTIAGDTFDMIALDFYNDENKAIIIAEANPQFADVLIFDAKTIMTIPIITVKAASALPPWKQV